MDPLNIVLPDIFCNMFNNLSMYHCMKGGGENLLFAILMKKRGDTKWEEWWRHSLDFI